MSKFEDKVKQDTPRLAVMFQRDAAGNELFQWGTVGKMPLLSLVGQIARVQGDLFFKAPAACPESALVITWDDASQSFDWFCHPDIPTGSLVGMLEMIKSALVTSHMARQMAAQQLILGPDGSPMRR